MSASNEITPCTLTPVPECSRLSSAGYRCWVQKIKTTAMAITTDSVTSNLRLGLTEDETAGELGVAFMAVLMVAGVYGCRPEYGNNAFQLEVGLNLEERTPGVKGRNLRDVLGY